MSTSIAEYVAHQVDVLPARSFVAVRDIEGPRNAVESAFSRLASDGTIARVRKGLYWKGTDTGIGMAPPRTEEIAPAIGGLGSGPAGVAAAHSLGLTTQVPSTYLCAVPGRAPAPCQGIRFVQRPVDRRFLGLTPAEVAVLEVLRGGPTSLESDWSRLGGVIGDLGDRDIIRLDLLDRALTNEPHRAARARWQRLLREPLTSAVEL